MVQKSGYWTINSRFLEILWFGYSFRASPLKHDSDFLKVTSALAARNYAPSQPPRCLHCVCFFSNLVGRPKRMVTWWWFPGWFNLTSVNLDPPTLSTEMKLRVLSFVWTCLNFWGWHWIILNPPEKWLSSSLSQDESPGRLAMCGNTNWEVEIWHAWNFSYYCLLALLVSINWPVCVLDYGNGQLVGLPPEQVLSLLTTNAFIGPGIGAVIKRRVAGRWFSPRICSGVSINILYI